MAKSNQSKRLKTTLELIDDSHIISPNSGVDTSLISHTDTTAMDSLDEEAVTINNRIPRLYWQLLRLTDGFEKAGEADALIEGLLFIVTTTCPPWTISIQLPMTTFYLNILLSVVLPLKV